jgi:hypothetical protein
MRLRDKRLRAAAATLVGAVLGVMTSLLTGLALVPRVKLVEVLAVVATGIGGGAALVAAIVQFKQAREDARPRSYGVPAARPARAAEQRPPRID